MYLAKMKPRGVGWASTPTGLVPLSDGDVGSQAHTKQNLMDGNTKVETGAVSVG